MKNYLSSENLWSPLIIVLMALFVALLIATGYASNINTIPLKKEVGFEDRLYDCREVKQVPSRSSYVITCERIK